MASRRVWQCKTRHPKSQFSIKIGTIFEACLNETYVSVEPFHLFRYIDEQAFRYNNRKNMTDGLRFNACLTKTVGKRLTYRQLTGKQASQFVFLAWGHRLPFFSFLAVSSRFSSFFGYRQYLVRLSMALSKSLNSCEGLSIIFSLHGTYFHSLALLS